MDDVAGGPPDTTTGSSGVFGGGQARTIELLARHSRIADVMRAVCDLVEESAPGSHATTVRIRADGTLDHVSTADPEPEVVAAISDHLQATVATAGSGARSARIDLTGGDLAQAQALWIRTLTGLDERVLGALCVTGEWPPDRDAQTAHDFEVAARLLQIGIEQHHAAQLFAATVSAERERIANDLHDDPIQEITVLSLMLQRLARDVPATHRERVTEARQRADHAIDRMRRMLFELHPAVLEHDGLAIATEVYLEETMEPLGIEWSVEDRLTDEPDAATGVLVYRLVHEALANVARHSAASTVTVELGNEDDGVTARIHDDGRGFDPTAITSHRPGHLGIENVRYLAQRTAGRFVVSSSPGNGCTIEIWIPHDHAPLPGSH